MVRLWPGRMLRSGVGAWTSGYNSGLRKPLFPLDVGLLYNFFRFMSRGDYGEARVAILQGLLRCLACMAAVPHKGLRCAIDFFLNVCYNGSIRC